MPKTETFNLMVRIPRELHDRVAAQAAAEDRSQRAIVTRALERELTECESAQKKATPKKKTRAA